MFRETTERDIRMPESITFTRHGTRIPCFLLRADGYLILSVFHSIPGEEGHTFAIDCATAGAMQRPRDTRARENFMMNE